MDVSLMSAYAELQIDRIATMYKMIENYKWENKNGEIIDIRKIDDIYFSNICNYLIKNNFFKESFIKKLKKDREDYKKQQIKNETNNEIEILKKKIKKLEDDKHFMMKRIEEITFYVREHYNINVKT